MNLINLCRYFVQHFLVVDNNGKENLLVVVKATFKLDGSALSLMDEQEPVIAADKYFGDPLKTSLQHACEMIRFKPATDVIFVGTAYAQGGGKTSVDLNLQVGKVRKSLRIFGDRYWFGAQGSEKISDPAPFERMPLIYEKAFGGSDDSNQSAPETFQFNPVGIGFRSRGSRMPLDGFRLPNIENPKQLIQSPADRPEPAGTGFIAPHWESRRLLAGTYDEDWLKNRAPFLPDDFNPGFYQTAPADQVYPGYMNGGEEVIIENASPVGPLAFALPNPRFDVSLMMRGEQHEIPMPLDTVVIDGDDGVVRMVWRGNFSVHNRVYDLEWIRVSEEVVPQ